MKSGGIVWFPHMCDSTDALRSVQCSFGIAGYGVIYKLYERIFSAGYYCEWNSKICKIFAYEDCKLKRELVERIVECCIEEDIFDADLYHKYGILTSAEIQKMYYHAACKREGFYFDERFCLVRDKKVVKPPGNSSNGVGTGEGRKCRSGEGNAGGSGIFEEFGKCREIEDYINLVTVNHFFDPWREQFDCEVMVYAVAICVLKNRCNPKYLEGILGNWKNYGYVCLDDIDDPILRTPEFMKKYPEVCRMRRLEFLGR